MHKEYLKKIDRKLNRLKKSDPRKYRNIERMLERIGK